MPSVADPALIEQLARKLFAARLEFENTRVKCGITGISGSGKSSLINAIAGEKIAQVSVVEETTEPQEHHHGGMVFVDLPGCGTARWPQDTYVKRLDLQSYDCFILVTAQRFYEPDAHLYHELAHRLQKPCFIVRNQFDLAIQQGRRDNDLSEEEVRRLIVENIRHNLEPHAPPKVYLTSAHYPQKYDLPRLISDIVESQHGSKQTRMMADVAVWSEEMLVKKRAIAERLVGIYAGLSAANALNPIPGLDVSLDLGMLVRLSDAVLHIYGLTQKQAAFTEKLIDASAPHAQAAKMLVTKLATQYGAEKAISLLLVRFGSSIAVKETAKWAPFVGTLVAGAVGFRLTYSFGEKLISDCENSARQFLRELET
ncbi:GTPase [Lignipirellula cremea]|uniref:GTPase Era n=1 Tax=Lignipirellula cremea TaxID=2528010 RepID=A0A518DZP0_9BACT|nr:GTPase [Lignipirellula cremea]QDU97308.1 GTPase Era [Lignipirellula cremea]